jgi:hypothetical protein
MRLTYLVVLMLIFSMGCGSSKPAADKALASEVDVLKEALEAWKSGAKPASLEQLERPIKFVDPDWNSGATLMEYRIIKAGFEDESAMTCTVGLKIELRGKTIDKSVSYRVVSSPKWVIDRNTFK